MRLNKKLFLLGAFLVFCVSLMTAQSLTSTEDAYYENVEGQILNEPTSEQFLVTLTDENQAVLTEALYYPRQGVANYTGEMDENVLSKMLAEDLSEGETITIYFDKYNVLSELDPDEDETGTYMEASYDDDTGYYTFNQRLFVTHRLLKEYVDAFTRQYISSGALPNPGCVFEFTRSK